MAWELCPTFFQVTKLGKSFYLSKENTVESLCQ